MRNRNTNASAVSRAADLASRTRRTRRAITALAVLSTMAWPASAQCNRRVWDRSLPPPQAGDGWFYDSAVWDDGSGPSLYGVGFIAVPEGSSWSDGVARWNGTSWVGVGGGVGYTNHGGYPEVHAALVHDGQLVIAGDFSKAGSIPAGNIARWDGTGWSTFGSGLPGIVYALCEFDGKLVAGYDGGVAAWDGNTWGPPTVAVFGAVRALAVYGNDLVIGGDFTVSLGGPAVTGALLWNGTAWSSLGVRGWVWSLAVYDGELIAGGYSLDPGGVSAPNIARWNRTRWAPLVHANELNGDVYALEEYEGALVVGGSFDSADGTPSGLVARWNANGSGAWSSMGGGLYQFEIDDFVGDFSVLDGDLIAAGRFYNLASHPNWVRSNWARWSCTALGNTPPVADTGGPYRALLYQSIPFDGTRTLDPDAGDLLYYRWDFGNGTGGTTIFPTTYQQFTATGLYPVTLRVFDGEAWSSPATTTARITAQPVDALVDRSGALGVSYRILPEPGSARVGS